MHKHRQKTEHRHCTQPTAWNCCSNAEPLKNERDTRRQDTHTHTENERNRKKGANNQKPTLPLERKKKKKMVSCFIIRLLIPGLRLGTTGLDVIPPPFYYFYFFFFIHFFLLLFQRVGCRCACNGAIALRCCTAFAAKHTTATTSKCKREHKSAPPTTNKHTTRKREPEDIHQPLRGLSFQHAPVGYISCFILRMNMHKRH